MQEIFKDIAGYEGLYQVSNLGNVKSYSRYKEGKILTPTVSSVGYKMVDLKGSIRKNSTIHRLVAKAFILNPENKKEVNHINGIKSDNTIENLEWVTPSENMKHSYRIGLNNNIIRRGKNSRLSIPIVQLTLDNNIIANYAGANEAARQIGGSSGSISGCCKGKAKTAYGFKWQYKI